MQKEQKYVLLAGMTGFILGICSANLWMKEYILDIGMFQQYYLEQYRKTDLVYKEYLWYLIKNRGALLFLLIAFAQTTYRKKVAVLTVIWLGFCAGLLACTAVIRMGSRGILLLVTAWMPQGIFYAMAGILLLGYMLEYPMSRWNVSKSIKFTVFLFAGIVTECYVNPVILKMFIKTI